MFTGIKSRDVVILVLSLSSILPTIAATTIDDIFHVATGSERWSCDRYRKDKGNGALDDMWADILLFNQNALDVLNWDTFAHTPWIWRSAHSYLGLHHPVMSPSLNAPRIRNKYELEKWLKVIESLRLVRKFISEPSPVKGGFFCDSSYLIWKEPTDLYMTEEDEVVLDDDGRPQTIQEVHERDPDTIQNPARYWILRDMTKRTYHVFKKTAWPREEFGLYPGDTNPTVCASRTAYGYTNFRGDEAPSIILCFDVMEQAAMPATLSLDPQFLYTELKTLWPKSQTLYHELFHAAVHLTPEGPTIDPLIPLPKPGTMVDNVNSMDKNDWEFTGEASSGPLPATRLIAYELAAPVAPVDELDSLRNPENYAWFAVAACLTKFAIDPHEWWSASSTALDSHRIIWVNERTPAA